MIIVFVCILISVLANVQGSLFIQNLIDDYITPMIQSGSRDFGPMLGAILRVAIFYAIGAASAFIYAKIMVYVTQGTMRDLRCQIFEHMESLPIKYFDTHPHGDIMSVYTNDIDTLRQMISQSIPQLFNSGITIIAVLVSMFTLSIPLTILTLIMVGVMLFVTKQLASRSGRFFAKQQADLGATNGYIEEMMNGQKVVKVFNHEKKSIEEFNELNDRLFNSSYNANKFANILMPINAQIGNISYVLCAIVGCIFALNNFLGFTIGKLVSFLTFNKSFTQPINQVSQQFNSIVMALAGADRIFKLLDEKPEVDDGYVTLVNVRKEGDRLVETEKKQVCGLGSILTVKQAKQSIVNSRVRLLWTMLTSVIQMIKSFFTILICTQNPVRRLRLSVQQVQAKQQSQTLLTDSMIFRTVKSVMTESISTKSKKATFAVHSV